jgi:AraC-like DNA-binding protein
MNLLTGQEIGLPLVAHVGMAHTHVAQRITWHSHPGHQLLFLLGGATTYEFRHPREKNLDLSGEHFAVIPPEVVHRGVRDMRPPCDLFFLVLAASARGADHSPFTATEWAWIEQHFCRVGIVAHPLSPDLRRVVTSLAAEVKAFPRRRQRPLAHARLRMLVCDLLIGAADQLTRTRATPPDAVVVAAEHYLRQHSDETLRMSEVARLLGMSRARLFDHFKRGTGMTPNDYLLRVRIEKARKMLVRPATTVTDTAFETGFSSSQYFSTVFRKYTGQTPREYRQSFGQVPRDSARPARGK